MIEDVTDLGYFQFTLEYDPRVVLAKGAVLGDFLGSTGRSTSGLGPRLDNSTGTLTFGGFSFGTVKGPEGKGVLAELTFSGLARGLSPLKLKNVLISDSDNQPLKGFTVEEGVAAVGGAPVVTPEPTATAVMATMTPLSLPTSAWTFTPQPRPPATVVPATPSVSPDQATPPSMPLSTATISLATTAPGATATAAASPGPISTATLTAASAVTITPTMQDAAFTPAPTVVVGGSIAPTVVSTPTPAMVARSGEQSTGGGATPTPILRGSIAGAAPQDAEASRAAVARRTPIWLIVAGLAVGGLAAAGLVVLALLWARRHQNV